MRLRITVKGWLVLLQVAGIITVIIGVFPGTSPLLIPLGLAAIVVLPTAAIIAMLDQSNMKAAHK